MTEVALIDAGGANLGSVRYALERLGVQVRLVRDAKGLQGVSRVILPGVGAAPHGMARLHAQDLVQPLRELQVRCWASAWACSCCSRAPKRGTWNAWG